MAGPHPGGRAGPHPGGRAGPHLDEIDRIARAVLYEGYLLWPYRRSAIKNQQRWTFGVLFPPSFVRRRQDGESSSLQLQCLVDGPTDGHVDITLRFLHVMDRQPLRVGSTPDVAEAEPVDELVVGDERHLAWQEATEREVRVLRTHLGGLASPTTVGVTLPGAVVVEDLRDTDGQVVGVLRRTWEPVTGDVEVVAERLHSGAHRLTVRVANTSPWDGDDRGEAAKRALCSAHVVVQADGAAMVSLTDPPQRLEEDAAACENIGVWPVLVGDDGDHHTMLASPIILSDHPRVAPESPGDLFDGCEIDELLVHSIRSLPEDERREIRDTDPRVREILERSEGLAPEQLMRLHGVIRELRPLRDSP